MRNLTANVILHQHTFVSRLAGSMLLMAILFHLIMPAPAAGAQPRNLIRRIQFTPGQNYLVIYTRRPVNLLHARQEQGGRHFRLILDKIGHSSKITLPHYFKDKVLQQLTLVSRGNTTVLDLTVHTGQTIHFSARPRGSRLIISWQPTTPSVQRNLITGLTVTNTLSALLTIQCLAPVRNLKLFYAPDRNRMVIELPNIRLSRQVKPNLSIQDDVLDSVQLQRTRSKVKVIVNFSEAQASSYKVFTEDNTIVVAPKPGVVFAQTLNHLVDHLQFKTDLTIKYARDVSKDNAFESSRDIRTLMVVGAKYGWGMQNFIKAGVRFRYIEEYDPGLYTLSDMRPAESYLNLVGDFLRVGVGYQTVRWGRTDEISPLDVINPEDLTEYLLNDRPERKIPIPLVRVTWFNDFFNLEGIYAPWFIPSLIIYRDSDWALTDHAVDHLIGQLAPHGAPLERLSFMQQEPAGSFWDKGDSGLRLTKSFPGFDVGLCYYYGYDKIPLLQPRTPNGAAVLPVLLDPRQLPLLLATVTPAFFDTLNGSDLTYDLTYHRFKLYGLDMEAAVGSVGLRAEVAYFENRHFQQQADLAVVSKNEVQYVVGADYHVWENFYINLLFSHAIILDNDQPLVAAKDAQQDVAGSISWDILRDSYTMKMNAAYNLEDNALVLRPEFIWHQSGSLDFELGWFYIMAPEEADAFLLKNNDQVFLKGRFHF